MLNRRIFPASLDSAWEPGIVCLVHRLTWVIAWLLVTMVWSGCGSVDPPAARTETPVPPPVEGPCEATVASPEYLQRIGCRTDFEALASTPLVATIPGARSVKVVLDTEGGDALYFQNSVLYRTHFKFASTHLSDVSSLPTFNATEYYSPERRFVLGAVTYYEGPQAWVLEIAPYDSALPTMIEKLYGAVKAAAYFGPALAFRPTSLLVEATAKGLSSGVRIKTTSDLFAGIDYQPLNLGRARGYLRFVRATQLSSTYLSSRDIVVLDHVPNDITVVMGLITQEFQTPLSHINVLSQNRGTPNMGLLKAMKNAELLALADKPVELDVGAQKWSIKEISPDEANQWWEEKRPAAVQVPNYDTEVTELRDVKDIVIESDPKLLKQAIKDQIPAYGGKAAHYSVLAKIPELSVPTAFAVPIHYYDQFMRENGFQDRLRAMLEDPVFTNDPAVRDRQLYQLRYDMMRAPVSEEFRALLLAKLEATLPGIRVVRFRSSTNGEDLDGFTGAGLYQSHSGATYYPESLFTAVRATWASTWRMRAFEERTYRGIDQKAIGMALLVHHTFIDELASGVCLTANPFDTEALEPAFYVNAQVGDESVVLPEPGVTTDEFLYYLEYIGETAAFLSQSNLVPQGQSVLTRTQMYQLGLGLRAIHETFRPAYGPASGIGWYAMDVEFKLSIEPGGDVPVIVFKQARPHPGRGTDPLAAQP